MQRTNDWMTFVVIFVGACLLGSCLAFATGSNDDDDSSSVAFRLPAASLQIEIEPGRKGQVQRADVVAGVIDSGVDEIAAAVRAIRFARLDAYAQEQHWTMSTPPTPMREGDGTLVWWVEWCALKPEADARASEEVSSE